MTSSHTALWYSLLHAVANIIGAAGCVILYNIGLTDAAWVCIGAVISSTIAWARTAWKRIHLPSEG